jgi:hypothetical protein
VKRSRLRALREAGNGAVMHTVGMLDASFDLKSAQEALSLGVSGVCIQLDLSLL